MAGEFYNPVPQGVAGTGAAYILPKSEAMDNYINNLAMVQHQADLNKAAQAQKLQSINKSYDDNGIKIIPGQLFNPELNGYNQAHATQGAKYRMNGIDIYHPDPTKPDEVKANAKYMGDRSDLTSMMGFRKEFEDNVFNKNEALLNNPVTAAKLDPDTVAAWNEFKQNKSGTNLADLYFGKIQAPKLENSFNQADFLKPIIAKTATVLVNDGYNEKTVVTANRPNIQEQVEAALQTDPVAQKMLIKSGVDIGILKGTKDKTMVMAEMDKYYQTPQGKAELERSQIPYGSKQYWDGLPLQAENRIQQSVDNYHKVVDKLVDTKAGEIDSKDENKVQFGAKNYALQLHNSGRADEMARLAQEKWNVEKTKNTAASKILDDPTFSTLKITETNNDVVGKKGDGTEIRTESPNPTYNYSTYSTTWQPVKGEGIALDVPNYQSIDINGHLVTSKTGGISRLRLAQVGNLPVLPSGSYANDVTLDRLAKQMKAFATTHPDATRMSISSGGSISIPKDKSKINASWFSQQLSHRPVAVMYDDQEIKKGKLAHGAKPILIPASQILSKIKANKIAVPEDDFLGLGTKATETDDFGL